LACKQLQTDLLLEKLCLVEAKHTSVDMQSFTLFKWSSIFKSWWNWKGSSLLMLISESYSQ